MINYDLLIAVLGTLFGAALTGAITALVFWWRARASVSHIIMRIEADDPKPSALARFLLGNRR